MLLAGELAPGIAHAVVLVDIVPDMEPAERRGSSDFTTDRSSSGFGSLEEVADAIAAYNPTVPDLPTSMGSERTSAAGETAGTGTGIPPSWTPRRHSCGHPR